MKDIILIVDDDPGNQSILEAILQADGHEVRLADNGADALTTISTHPVDLILMDIMMPEIDGIEVCRRLKSDPVTAGIPVIFISGLNATSDKITAFEAGGVDYITKPFMPGEVLARIRTHLSLARTQKQLNSLNRELTAEIEARQTLERLQANAELYVNIFSHIGIGVALISPDMRILLLNPVMRTMYPQIDVSSRPICYESFNTPPRRGICSYCPTIRTFRDGNIHVSITETPTELGVRNHKVTTAPVLEKDGTISAVIEVVEDVTDLQRLEKERLELERRMYHSQKLESLGVMAGGIAHDFNNILATILGNIELVRAKLPGNAPVQGNISRALDACQRAVILIRQLLDYAGKSPFLIAIIDLNQVIQEHAAMFRASVARSTEFTIDTAPSLPPIKGARTQIQQIITNILINASEAIGSAPGHITLSTDVVECDENYLSRSRIEEKPPAGTFVRLEIVDTGCGMNEHTHARIFEPFFTTKFMGRGLGMSAALGIIRAHGGAIMLDSVEGRGTIFRVLFPVHEERRKQPRKGEPQAGRIRIPAGSTATILVVDDELEIRTMCMSIIEHLGYRTIGAENGREALDIFKSRQDEITLVILDMTMPVMDGVRAFHELRKLSPGIPVILSSGFSEDDVGANFLANKPSAFLQKPYSINVLKEKIHLAVGIQDEEPPRPTP